MHETSLMYNVLKTLEVSIKENNIEEITELKLVIGNITTIFPDALRFAFDSFKGNPPLAKDANLIIEERKPEAECADCMEIFTLQAFNEFICPKCKRNNIKILGGEELFIEYYKGRECIHEHEES